MWITNGPQLISLSFYANKDFASMGRSPTGFVSSFIMKNQQALCWKSRRKLGIACSGTSALDSVFVPDENHFIQNSV